MITTITPGVLNESDLFENSGKSEEYKFSRASDDDELVNCNYLEYLLQADRQTARRKLLSLDVLKTLDPAIKSRKRKLSSLEHLLKLDERTHARIALKEFLKTYLKKNSRKAKIVYKDIKENSGLNMNFNSDRKRWKESVKHMLQ